MGVLNLLACPALSACLKKILNLSSVKEFLLLRFDISDVYIQPAHTRFLTGVHSSNIIVNADVLCVFSVKVLS